MSTQISIFKVISEGKASKRFLFAAILSFGFSIGVILSTIGLMDGFEHTLRSSLKNSNSDFIIHSTNGYFFSKELRHLNKGYSTAAILQTQAFAVGDNNNRGVLVKGIVEQAFNDVTEMNIKLGEDKIVIGQELAKDFSLQVGDSLLLALASNKKQDQGSAILKRFEISDIITHGIYEKDLRVVYLDKAVLEEIFGYKPGTSNKFLVKQSKSLGFESSQFDIEKNLPEEFYVSPFWEEYKTLINAVEVEKNSITLILQIIVLVSIFNILAFIIFIFEKKSQDFFLLRALGLSAKALNRFWIKMLIGIWFFSCLFAVLLAHGFNFILSDLNLFKLPGDIYVLNKLRLVLTTYDYILVFLASLIWIVLIGLLTNYRLRKRSLLAGLRQEFR
jgi:ABC-type lipoprotein release transport system permease subunit